MKVLHIEQSKFFSNLIKCIILEEGFNYNFTDDFEKALEIIKTEKIDLIVTSFFARNRTLEEFLLEIKSIDDNIPVFLVSANCITEENKRIINAGITDYISKENIEEDFKNHLKYISKREEYSEKLKKCKIALLEDNEFERKIQTDILKKYEVENVSTFKSGKELIDSNEIFDIYLIDIILDKEFGKDYIRLLRMRNDEAIIIAVTTLNNNKILADLLDNGADDIINKPIDERLYISKLKTHIRLKDVKNIEEL